MLDQGLFCYTVQNTGKYNHTSVTMTTAIVGGALTTNSGNITTITTGVMWRTQRQFVVGGQQTPIYVEMCLALTAAVMATNSTLDVGLFMPGAANPFAPTDGVYIRFNSSGVHLVTFNANSTEQATTLASFAPVANQVYSIVLAITNRAVQVWIDDVLHERRNVLAGLPQLISAGSLPFALRHAIAGGAAGSAVQGKLFSYSVYGGDLDRVKDWGSTMVAAGGSLQVQAGGTTGGQLTTYALGAAPGAVTLTASTAPATNTLGGLYLLPAVITPAESDYPLFAWQNPAGTLAVPGKLFHCTGVVIGDQGVNTALVGGPLLMSWSVGFGSTAASLATTESASFAAATTKIARKIPLGVMQAHAVTAAVGTISKGGSVTFNPPLPVNPGEFLHAILRVHGGTATSAGAIRGSVSFLGYSE
jgi:hypothetical protein